MTRAEAKNEISKAIKDKEKSKYVDKIIDRIYDFMGLSAIQRVAYFINKNNNISIPKSKIAKILFMTPETLSRQLKKLEAKNIIKRRSKGKIVIINKKALNRELNES